MKKTMREIPAPPPARKELSDNPVKLCNEIARLCRARMREVNLDGVMSQPGARLVLSVLALNDGISQREVVERTHLRPPTVSVILKKMEGEGMVELRTNPLDKRASCIYLTDHGKEVDMNGIRRIKETEAFALECVSEDEQRILMSLLYKIRDRLLDDKKGEEE